MFPLYHAGGGGGGWEVGGWRVGVGICIRVFLTQLF